MMSAYCHYQVATAERHWLTKFRCVLSFFAVGLAAVCFALADAEAQQDERRVALVVGIDEYDSVPDLLNPVNDATAISERLTGLGFDVIEATDVNRDELLQATSLFGERAANADVALFFYAGHAIQYEGQNFLVPVDGQLTRESDIRSWLLDIDTILRQLRAPTNIVMLDACRNNPFEELAVATRNVRGSGGLAPLHAAHGTFIAYATEPNRVAYDGEGNHSPFTNALLRHIDAPGLEIGSLMRKVRNDVYQETGQRQVPWQESSLFHEFYFAPEVEEPRQFAETVEQRSDPPTDDPWAPPGINHPPQAAERLNPVVASNQETRVDITLQPAIRDPDGDALWTEVIGLPDQGAIRVDGKQVMLGDRQPLERLAKGQYFLGFDPELGPAGSLKFRVYDREFAVATELPITIEKANEPPVFDVDETLVVTLGSGPQRLNIKAPRDPDGDSVFVTVVEAPSNGQLAFRGATVDTGTTLTTEQLAGLSYAPPGHNPDAADQFTLKANDGSHDVVREIRIDFNTRPTMAAWRQPEGGERRRANSGVFDLQLPTPKDADGDRLTIRVTGVPSNGRIYLGGGDRPIDVGTELEADQLASLMFEPISEGAGFLVIDISDGRGARLHERFPLTVAPPNQDPRIPRPDARLTAQVGQATPLGLGKPIDPEDDVLFVLLETLPDNGEIVVDDRPVQVGDYLRLEDLLRLRFLADTAVQGGSGTFRYIVHDDKGGQAEGRLTIDINHPPSDQEWMHWTTAGAAPLLLVPTSPSDEDGDDLTIIVRSLPVFGKVIVGNRTLNIGSHLAASDLVRAQLVVPETTLFYGPAGAFEYEIDDKRGGKARGVAAVNINTPPLAPANPEFEFDMGKGLVQRLPIQEPFDRDGDALEIDIIALPERGALVIGERRLSVGDRLSIAELGQLQMALEGDEGVTGPAGQLVYAARDTHGAVAEASLAVRIKIGNRPPQAPSGDIMVQNDGGPIGIFAGLGDRPRDPDDDPMEIVIREVPRLGQIEVGGQALGVGSRVSLDDAGDILYRPSPYNAAAGALIYTVEDSRGGRATGQIALTLNSPPEVSADLGQARTIQLNSDVERMSLFTSGSAADTGLIPLPTDDVGDALTLQIRRLPDAQGFRMTLHGALLQEGDVIDGADEFAFLELEVSETLVGNELDLGLTVKDDKGGETPVDVLFSVTERPNDPPSFFGQGPRTLVEKSGPQDLNIPTPVDENPTTVTVIVTDVPNFGRLLLGEQQIVRGHPMPAKDVPMLRYDPDDAEPGAGGSIRLTAIDDRNARGEGLFSIRIDEKPNSEPLIAEQPDQEMVIGVGRLPLPLVPPTDPDNDPLTVQISAIPQNGDVWFGDRLASAGMLLESEEFNEAYFIPHEEKRLVRGGSESALEFLVDDGRGGIARGSIGIQTRLHSCDQLASSASNLDSVSDEGVVFARLDHGRAIPACEKAVDLYDQILRFRFQLGRALHAGSLYEEAWEHYYFAARSGDIAAQYNLAMLLLDPNLPPGDRVDNGGRSRVESALRWLRSAGESGWMTTAQTAFATVVLSRRDELPSERVAQYEREAQEWLETGAKQRDPIALTLLGKVHVDGDLGLEPDPRKAEGYFNTAAELGHAEAMTRLGYLYASGLLPETDLAKAAEWFAAGAERQDTNAQFALATLYALGDGVPKNPMRARGLYRDACAAEPSLGSRVFSSLDKPRDKIYAIQSILSGLGYNPGTPDGVMGRRTRAALNQYSADHRVSFSGLEAAEILIELSECRS